MAILNRFSAILLYCDSTLFLLLPAEFLAGARDSRSLRNDNKISRQLNLHVQNFIVVVFPTKNSILDDFLSATKAPPSSKTQKFIFIVVSPSLRFWGSFDSRFAILFC